MAEDQPNIADQIRQTLLEDRNMTPYRYQERRPGSDYMHLHPNILRRSRFAKLQRRCRKYWAGGEGGGVVKDVLDGKDPLATPTNPRELRNSGTRCSPVGAPPENDHDYIDLLELVSLEEIVWLKKSLDRSSAPGPDGMRTADFLAIPNDRLQAAYTEALASRGVQFCMAVCKNYPPS